MKKRLKYIIIAVGIILIILLIGWFIIGKRNDQINLETKQPTYGYISQSVTATGKIEPVDTVTVGSQVSGIIKNLYVDFNSTVKKGDLLAQLDKTLLQATLDQYNGALQSAESQLSYAKVNYERQDFLFNNGAISKADHDVALNTYNTAKASVLTARAQVKSAEKNLSFTDIYSPIDGVVLNRNISIGQTVAASFNTPTLFIIARDIKKMEVEANVDEADIGNVTAGNRVTFSVDAFADDQFNGTVKDIRLHPSVSANVVTYTTIINTPNDDMKLKPGMTANIIIYTKEIKNALLIPAGALTFKPDSTVRKSYAVDDSKELNNNSSAPPNSSNKQQTGFVWLLKDKNLKRVKVSLGINDNVNVQILDGLTTNDNVAIAINRATKSTKSKTSSPFIPQRTGGGR
ncbi:efflux RND transporter periplasmic adaptor subunit [Pedobacter sp. ASV28]|uniref:efflux RND transporter periplasmic adaptor subunit n=1 Tax=Pedobacter sp. ASV28 TaxID=2795123 RepID=UPI0018EBAEE9|nr:efflux RND transporter periplasmic adaptor subunit [Pedobacter sp. ASV28]